jgi:hypothetical protein
MWESDLNHWLQLAAFAALAGGLVGALVWRRKRADSPTYIDPVSACKRQIGLMRDLEDELLAAGQSLGRARRYLTEADRADPLVAEVRARLSEVWLRRMDLEGRLRLASLRRRIPAPPTPAELRGALTAEHASHLVMRLSDHMEALQALSERAKESGKVLGGTNPGQDPHARWVGTTVELAQQIRRQQVEAIGRFSNRMVALAQQCGEVSLELSARIPNLPSDPKHPGARPDDHLLAGLSTLGLEERTEPEAGPTDHDAVIERGEAASEAALRLAREALQGSTDERGEVGATN